MAIYAAQTAVNCASSQFDIKRTLDRYGATAFAHAEKSGSAMIEFQMDGKRIRFLLPLPSVEDFAKQYDGRSKCDRIVSPERRNASWEQSCRQKWRALALVIKAKLEAVTSQITTLEKEFMAHIVLPNGRTAGEVFLPRIDEAYKTGAVPSLDWEG